MHCFFYDAMFYSGKKERERERTHIFNKLHILNTQFIAVNLLIDIKYDAATRDGVIQRGDISARDQTAYKSNANLRDAVALHLSMCIANENRR